MRILIGTPIHQVKDYSMERWLKNVAELRKQTPADFLMVDNTPGTDYVNKVKEYCQKIGIENYKIKHLELPAGQGKHERVAKSWETIRKYIIAHGYDAWFSWECDQIIPKNALDVQVKHMNDGGYQLVHANTWARELPGEFNPNFGCALISRQSLKKYSFFDKENMHTESAQDPWDSAEILFKRRVLKGGGKYIELYGLIDPIHHLDR